MCEENRECKCIGEILRVINILQRKAEREEEEVETCDREKLGEPCERVELSNTRPIQLFIDDHNGNDPLVMPTTRDEIEPGTVFSSVFRVEKIDECCCTCRVLKRRKKHENDDPDREHEECREFEATNSFFTIDLRFVYAVRCLADTFIEGV